MNSDFIIPKLIACGVGFIISLFVIFGSFFTIDQGDRGVVLTNGAVSSEVGPGLHWKMPMVQGVQEISMRSQQVAWNGDSKISAYTKDKQVADVHLTVTYRLTNATQTYVDYRSNDGVASQVLIPKTLEIFKNAFGQVNSTDAITNRERLNATVWDQLQKAVKGYPLMVLAVQITDISFSDAYDNAVAANMEAQVAVLKATAEMQRKNIEADTRLYAAKADGDAMAYRGQKEAEAIRAKGDALRASPDVVALTAAQKWDGALPSTMVPGSAVPFIDVRKQ